MLAAFDRFQTRLEDKYEAMLSWQFKYWQIGSFKISHRLGVLASALVLFFVSLGLVVFISKTFLPANDLGEFSVSLEAPVGTSLEGTLAVSKKIETVIKSLPEVDLVTLTVGSIAY